MTTYVVFLRAVNLPGHGKVAMRDLTTAISDLGAHDVRSVLQTGNVVFRDDKRTAVALEGLLEAHVENQLNLRTTFFVRTEDELGEIIARNPYRDEAKNDPGHLIVEFLKGMANAAAVKRLQAATSGPETIAGRGKQVYIVYPAGIGRSKLTNKLIEDKLRTRGTARNWNTMLKLSATVRE